MIVMNLKIKALSNERSPFYYEITVDYLSRKLNFFRLFVKSFNSLCTYVDHELAHSGKFKANFTFASKTPHKSCCIFCRTFFAQVCVGMYFHTKNGPIILFITSSIPKIMVRFFLKCTVGKIQTPIITFFLKKVVNISILKLGPVSNESPGISTYYRGILCFLKPSIF